MAEAVAADARAKAAHAAMEVEDGLKRSEKLASAMEKAAASRAAAAQEASAALAREDAASREEMSAKAQLAEWSGEMKQLRGAKESAEQLCGRLQQELKQGEADRRELQQSVAALQEEGASLRFRLTEVEESCNEELSHNRSQAHQARKEMTDAKMRAEALQGTCDALRVEVDELNRRLSLAERRHAEARQEISRYSSQVSSLATKEAETHESKDALNKQVKELQIDNERLRVRLAETSSSCQKLRRDLILIRDEYASMESELEKYRHIARTLPNTPGLSISQSSRMAGMHNSTLDSTQVAPINLGTA